MTFLTAYESPIMLLHRLRIEEVDTATILPLRTRGLRPHFSPGELAHFEGDDDAETHHFAAIDDNAVIAVVTYLPEAMPEDRRDAIRLRGMAVAADHRRRGVGSHLLTTTLSRLPLFFPTTGWVWCNARQSVIPFYEHHGFEPFGQPFSVESIGPHQRMRRRLPTAIV